ncbi:LysR family transcriptional regulator [Thauera humireducens]|uniref:LysR family transcriptional regulator n=1 Tax=Thauera humireducens TaxID=1134435 RepID=UPI0031203816
MELLALRTFEAVVDEGGILAASRKLNTVQSNVTARIRRLEEELGTELFFRSGRGVELAPAGRVLLDYARRMLNLERQTVAAVRHAGDEAGELRIGSMETFAALHLPSALSELRATHPALELRVRADTSATLVPRARPQARLRFRRRPGGASGAAVRRTGGRGTGAGLRPWHRSGAESADPVPRGLRLPCTMPSPCSAR